MNRRSFVEFVIAWILVLFGGIVTILPIFNISNVKIILIIILSIYALSHLIKNLFILSSKDYSGFFTCAASIISLIMVLIMDVNNSPWNLALILFIWIIIMSIIKLKESDYYHDRKNRLWLLNIVNLILFILTGILCAVNLYYTGDIQIIIIGFFFLINGILELMDPLVAYIMNK